MENFSNMYAGAKTWNPFVGCKFDCTYCRPSFRAQAKRRKQNCLTCYDFAPHIHAERLAAIPAAKIIFVAGSGDISFCPIDFTRQIIARISQHGERCPHKTYYLQSKRPACFGPILAELPKNVILVTTLETNRDAGYAEISKAPLPSERFRQFRELKYPRKVVTIEPIMDFDLHIFSQWIRELRPEYVWIGFNSRPASVTLPEPSLEKVEALMQGLAEAGIQVRGKTLRGLKVPKAATLNGASTIA